jgi:outer membrane protein assembly factor BamE
MQLLMRKLLTSISVIASLFLAACSSDPVVNRLPFVYRIDIQQGNVVNQEMVDQLHVGMTKRQVQFVLGAPMLIDPFHAERWDYVYIYNPGSDGANPATQQRVTLEFENDRVTSITGNLLPDPQPDTIPQNRQVTVVVPRQEPESVGILTKLWRWMGFSSDT